MTRKTLGEIQDEIGEWAGNQFGTNPNRSVGHPGYGSPLGSLPPLLGMGEEVGEITHGYLYRLQGRGDFHDTPFYVKTIRDGLGDLLVFMCDFATRVEAETGERMDLEEILNAVWEKVSHRRRMSWNADKAAEDLPPSPEALGAAKLVDDSGISLEEERPVELSPRGIEHYSGERKGQPVLPVVFDHGGTEVAEYITDWRDGTHKLQWVRYPVTERELDGRENRIFHRNFFASSPGEQKEAREAVREEFDSYWGLSGAVE